MAMPLNTPNNTYHPVVTVSGDVTPGPSRMTDIELAKYVVAYADKLGEDDMARFLREAAARLVRAEVDADEIQDT